LKELRLLLSSGDLTVALYARGGFAKEQLNLFLERYAFFQTDQIRKELFSINFESLSPAFCLSAFNYEAVNPLMIKNSPLKHFLYNRQENAFIFSTFETSTALMQQQIIYCILLLSTWWHALHCGLLLHASAVSHNDGGYLFLGKGGSGKTTVSLLSLDDGKKVLGDDLVVLSEQDDKYVLVSTPNRQKQIISDLKERPFLKGIFRLVKDNKDFLTPMTEIETAKTVFAGFNENYTSYNIPQGAAIKAFHTACAVARQVPGYELHFRKTPNFWDVINSEFSCC